MKTEISRDSYQPGKCYSGVYQQQGRMLTDADWNELVEILKARLNDALKDVVGNKQGSTGGTPRHRRLKVIKELNTDPLTIQPGHIYVDGIAAQIPNSSPHAYDEQPDFHKAPPLPEADYILYADVWERTVTHLMDKRLRDKGLHGADTCSRKQMFAQIKWCEKTILPEQSDLNPGKGNAGLTLILRDKITEADTCDPCAAELNIDSKVGNYLFRVEVHDVKGNANDPDEITLKWSNENGAEQYLALATRDEMPAGFISNKWVYEFFDLTSERHLGVHFVASDSDSDEWQPVRSELKRFNETNTYSVTKPDPDQEETFIRRWDGYCILNLKNGDDPVCVDQGGSLGSGDIILGETLHIALSSIDLELELKDKSFVAGDFWLADVRQSEHSEGSVLLDQKSPQGIEHHYLTLGEVIGGVLQLNPEADRKYAFPTLTEMTRMFIAGGDGQEAMPGHDLPQPIEVAVANGQWRVKEASVKFEIKTSDGSGLLKVTGETDAAFQIVKTNPEGIAGCVWQMGPQNSTDPLVKVTLIDPDEASGQVSHDHPPLYFKANLSTADRVAYEPNCPDAGENAVHSLLAQDGEVLLDLGEDGYYTVKEVLDALLCKLKAKHIPYDPTISSGRWEDINESSSNLPQTVQDAIDQLVNNLEASDILYELPDCETTDYGVATFKELIKEKIVVDPGETNPKIKAVWDAVLCFLDAKHTPYDHTINENRWNEINQGSWNYITEEYSLNPDWAKSYGGGNAEYIRGIAMDSDGNVVLTGTFTGTINFGGATLVSETDSAIFLVKLQPTGEHIWSEKYEVQSKQSSGQSVIVDRNQNIILVAAEVGNNDVYSIVVRKLSNAGSEMWKTEFISQETGYGYTAAVDSENNVIVSGFFQGKMFTISGNLILTSVGESDIFLAKFKGNDGQIEWVNNFGGSGYEIGHNVKVDSVNNIVLTGFFQEKIKFGESGPELTSQGKSDIFVAKFYSKNGTCIWANSYGGTISDYGRGLALDKKNNIYLTGYFQKEITFGNANNLLVSKDGYDIYIAKLSADGEHIWSRAFSGTKSDFGHAVAITSDGTLALAGYFAGTVNLGGKELVSKGETDAFFAFFNPDGNHLYSESIGGAEADQSTQLAAGPNNSLVIVGTYRSNITIGNIQLTSSGQSDVFVARLLPPSTPPATVQSAIDILINALESYLNKEGAQTITGPLTIDDGPGTPSTETLLDVKGKVIATAFEGDGSALSGISAGKWSDGAGGSIYYNTGNIGIGTQSPEGVLHVTRYGNDSKQLVIGNKNQPSSEWFVRVDNSTNFSVNREGLVDIPLYIKNNGNVGIGINNPESILHIKGSSPILRLQDSEGGSNAEGSKIRFTEDIYQYLGAYLHYDGSVNKFHVGVHNSQDSNQVNDRPAITILRSNGNVGINATSPNYTLHTNGISFAAVRRGGGIDYAEYFESLNGKEISPGTAVVFEKGMIRKAKKNEMPIGVISANPIIAGGVHAEWPKKYLRDEFGQLIMETYQDEIMAPKKEKLKKERQKVEMKTIEEKVTRTEIVFEKKKYCQKEITETVTSEIEVPVFKEVDLYDAKGKNIIGRHQIPVIEIYLEEIDVLDEEGQPIFEGTGKFVTDKRPKLNPDYDESKEYISREDRPEWNCVGLLGQLSLRKGQPIAPSWIKIRDISDELELWLVK